MNIHPDEKRKVIAAIMEVTLLRFFRNGHVARKKRKCLVYDPKEIVPLMPPKSKTKEK